MDPDPDSTAPSIMTIPPLKEATGHILNRIQTLEPVRSNLESWIYHFLAV